MSKFDEFLDAVRSGSGEIAKKAVQDAIDAGKSDVETFLQQSKDRLEKWTKQLANGEITREEFRFLVKGQADLAAMFALTQLGIAQARIEKFRKLLIDLIVDSAIDVFL